jgi:forkhead box protein K
VGPLPSSYVPPQSSTGEPVKRPPIVLHENALILDPVVFGTLTPQRLVDLEAQGAQKALEALQAHLVAFLREKRGAGSRKNKKKKTGAPGAATGQAASTSATGEKVIARPANPLPSSGWTPQPPALAPQDSTDELIVVDDSGDEGPAAKKRRTVV